MVNTLCLKMGRVAITLSFINIKTIKITIMKKLNRRLPVVVILAFVIAFKGNAQEKGEQKNYAIIPKLPPAPKAEPFVVTTIPLPADVSDAVLINYLPDAKHLIMEIHMAGKKK